MNSGTNLQFKFVTFGEDNTDWSECFVRRERKKMPPTSQRLVVLFLMLMLNEFSASSRERHKADLVRSQHTTASLLSPTLSAFPEGVRDQGRASQKANNQTKNNNRHGKFIKLTSDKIEQDRTERLVGKIPRTLGSKHDTDQDEQGGQKAMYNILPNTPSQGVAIDLHAPFEESSSNAHEHSKSKGDGEQNDALDEETAKSKNPPNNEEENQTLPTKLVLRRRREAPRQQNSSSVQPNSTSIKCGKKLSCRNRCTIQRALGQRANLDLEGRCYCDSDCEMFQDCCADYDDHCSATNMTSRASPDVQWKCVSQGGRDFPNIEISGIWMISSCPKSWRDDQVRSACIQFPDSAGQGYEGPVPVTATSGATFKNRFCAQCNGVVQREITYYDLFYHPRSPDEVFWHPPFATQVRYCLDLISSCILPDISRRDIQERCEEGTFRIVRENSNTNVPTANFKNRFCMQCSLGDDRSRKRECGPKTTAGDAGAPYFVQLFRPSTPPSSLPATIEPCSGEEVFDRTSGTCRPGIIRPALNATSNRLALLIWIKPHSLLGNRTHVNQSQIMDSLHIYFGIYPQQVSNVHIKEMSNASLVWFDVMERDVEQITEAAPTPPYGIDTLLNFTGEVNFTVGESKYDIYKASHWLLACADYEEFLEGEYAVLPLYPAAVRINRSRETHRSSQSAVYINRSREILHPHEYFTNKTKKLGGRPVPVGTISVCRLYLSANCANGHMSLRENEYTVFPNGSLYRNASREYIPPGWYDLRNRTAWICADDPITERNATKTTNTDGNLALNIFTMIGLSLSIFSLAVFLLTYSLFAELRTLPGVNLMNLSVSLLLLHSLWLAVDQARVPLLCTFIAASIHFLALASFTWMSTIAFNTWYVFSRSHPLRLRGKSLKRKILKYMAIGWVPPLIFVLICATLDKTQALHIGYGAGAVCFIKNQRAGLCLLGVPVAISVVFNAVFFLKTFLIIRRTREQTRSVASQSRNRVNFKLYARLAVLMGFTWVFGFLAHLFSYYNLLYPFVVLNTLQGVYIAVAYLLKSRVKELYGQLFHSQIGQAPDTAPAPRHEGGRHATQDTRL